MSHGYAQNPDSATPSITQKKNRDKNVRKELAIEAS